MFIILFFFYITQGWAQLSSGIYSSGLHIAFDSTHQTITGYFEEYSGLEEETGQSKFSCIFFIHGKLKNNFIPIKTYYPFEQNADTIIGYIKIITENSFEMKLDEEHGGCWNVTHFSDEPIIFTLEEKINRIQISYFIVPEMKIYSDFTSNKKLIHSIKSNQIINIEDKEKSWCRILVGGKSPIRGWVSSKDLFGF